MEELGVIKEVKELIEMAMGLGVKAPNLAEMQPGDRYLGVLPPWLQGACSLIGGFSLVCVENSRAGEQISRNINWPRWRRQELLRAFNEQHEREHDLVEWLHTNFWLLLRLEMKIPAEKVVGIRAGWQVVTMDTPPEQNAPHGGVLLVGDDFVAALLGYNPSSRW